MVKLRMINDLKLRLSRLKDKENNYINRLTMIIQPYFNFDIEITFCQGDGYLILDVGSKGNVYSFKCLKEYKGKKLTQDIIRDYGI